MDDAMLNAINIYEKMYGIELPVINEDLILVTTTFPKKNAENRVRNLCRLGRQIVKDKKIFWLVVEDGEQPNYEIKYLLKDLGIQYVYLFTGHSQSNCLLDTQTQNCRNDLA